ncbi:hypothetical protein Poli38472_012706 [Pythium oligandrum]|uniref:Lipase-like C-terminal domain-containing protein n=1 Tax=Pythium oligandrum TaxID=41045 RepID=A0A8K1FFC9_PYTOL|nr:hypothetical protein Poli38472_012706 [Pythium oligandrum]|eukprot:TMW61515.1 hypothetical protein Poli38472_012706 [Pythium oligandrum]
MRGLLTLVLLALSALTALADNKYPIVLVHGFAGWGRDELLGVKYWGGIQGDLQEQLKAQGYTVYTAAVGPFSSNWDRACELYAQIKGGQVDYGANHAAKHGHARYGRTFPGLYPQWGNTTNGAVNKVHLIGHSMGGQTVRMLAQLLASGSKGAPVEESVMSHPLFAGGKNWVHSITTIAAPNQGTLLGDGFSQIGDLVKSLVIGVFSVLGVGSDATSSIYDAKLDQWGLEAKGSSESLSAYINRIFASPVFAPGFKDICLWSLSTSGAAEENKWVKTLSNVYYYSYANVDTYAWVDILLRSIQLPNLLTMLLPLQPLGTFIGGRYGPNSGFTESWQANDGVVNTYSMGKDSTGSAVTFAGTSTLGVWMQMPQLDHMDHLAVVGTTLHTQVKDVYVAHARLLYSLPTTTSSRNLAEQAATVPSAVVDQINSAVSALNTASGNVKSKADVANLCADATSPPKKSYCDTMLNSTTTRRSLRTN